MTPPTYERLVRAWKLDDAEAVGAIDVGGQDLLEDLEAGDHRAEDDVGALGVQR